MVAELLSCGILKTIEYVMNKKTQVDVSLLEQ